jgi:hypothetical protein
MHSYLPGEREFEDLKLEKLAVLYVLARLVWGLGKLQLLTIVSVPTCSKEGMIAWVNRPRSPTGCSAQIIRLTPDFIS